MTDRIALTEKERRMTDRIWAKTEPDWHDGETGENFVGGTWDAGYHKDGVEHLRADHALALVAEAYDVAAEAAKGKGESEFFNPVQAIRALTPSDALIEKDKTNEKRYRKGYSNRCGWCNLKLGIRLSSMA